MAKLLWTQKQDVGPRPRFGHAMAFDPNRQRVVLFGGNILNNQLLKDTWEWNGEDWTQVEDIGPSGRSGHAMAYDTARGRLVLFGGNTGAADVRDTWEWDGTAWTQVQDTGPSARIGHAMAFDNARGRVLLFGGAPTAGAPLADTWEWDGTDWVQVEDAGPAPRQGHAMAYDTARSRAVVFGGVGAATQDGFADTWEWDGTVWTQVADIGPEGCVHAALVFKSSTSSLFGGISTLANVATRQLFGVTWEGTVSTGRRARTSASDRASDTRWLSTPCAAESSSSAGWTWPSTIRRPRVTLREIPGSSPTRLQVAGDRRRRADSRPTPLQCHRWMRSRTPFTPERTWTSSPHL